MLPLSASAEAVAHSPRSRARERRGGLTGIELDRRMREILLNATRATSLSSAAALVDLGFGAMQSFDIVCTAILAKEGGTWRKSRTKRRRNN
jgi:hypothetical protein